jgi:hypothetical protein
MSEELKELARLYEENDKDLDVMEEEVPDFEIVDSSDDWTQDGKYQHKTTVVRWKDKWFAFSFARSGSYHTDWHYAPTQIQEVARREVVKVTVEWDTLRNDYVSVDED